MEGGLVRGLGPCRLTSASAQHEGAGPPTSLGVTGPQDPAEARGAGAGGSGRKCVHREQLGPSRRPGSKTVFWPLDVRKQPGKAPKNRCEELAGGRRPSWAPRVPRSTKGCVPAPEDTLPPLRAPYSRPGAPGPGPEPATTPQAGKPGSMAYFPSPTHSTGSKGPPCGKPPHCPTTPLAPEGGGHRHRRPSDTGAEGRTRPIRTMWVGWTPTGAQGRGRGASRGACPCAGTAACPGRAPPPWSHAGP